jgi:hypothetical protein
VGTGPDLARVLGSLPHPGSLGGQKNWRYFTRPRTKRPMPYVSRTRVHHACPHEGGPLARTALGPLPMSCPGLGFISQEWCLFTAPACLAAKVALEQCGGLRSRARRSQCTLRSRGMSAMASAYRGGGAVWRKAAAAAAAAAAPKKKQVEEPTDGPGRLGKPGCRWSGAECGR